MTYTVLVAPSGFKESMGAEEAAQAIAAGVRKAMPTARILRAPMVDGGEGFTKAIVEATGGRLRQITVTGPVGKPVGSFSVSWAAASRAPPSWRWPPPPA